MTTAPFEHQLGPGQILIADVSLCAVPFGWVAEVPAGVQLAHDFSISQEPGDWQTPATNETITETVHDTENTPIRFLRWRHTSGAGAATIRIGAVGRVSWSVA